MGWKEKSANFSFEHQPIDGLFFLDGKLLANVYPGYGIENYKFPVIYFPSGNQFDLWEHKDPTNGIVHLFGEMDLALYATRDEALTHAKYIASQVGYLVKASGDNVIEAMSFEEERLKIIYDAANGRMSDVVYLKTDEQFIHPAHDLLPPEIREQLPKLYTVSDSQGVEAVAPVKYFTPDAQWTWYPIEFDGADIFVGLVIGDEIEFGFFSLSELKESHGALGLPVERDLHFTPATLRELKEKHEQERRGGH